MWLALKIPPNALAKNSEQNDSALDTLLEFSPRVALGPEGTALIHLAGAARYWGLASLGVGPSGRALPSELEAGAKKSAHPFLLAWAQWQQRWQRRDAQWEGRAVLAPTAPWAYAWLQAGFGEKENTLQYIDRDTFARAWADTPLLAQRLLLPDLLGNSETRLAFDHFCEQMEELGLERARDLTRAAPQQWVQRFGPFMRRLLGRLQGSDDLASEWYTPPLQLRERFYPRLERLIDSERTSELCARVEEVLQNWEERLRARRAWLRGLQVRVGSERRGACEVFTLTLPRPTRDTKILSALFREKWLTLCERSQSNFFFDDALDTVELSSLGLQDENDRQLNLFDEKKEENNEQWDLLLGRLWARGTPREPVQVGRYAPRENWFPEMAMEWVPWGETTCLPQIPDHPRRPVFLLEPPQRLTHIDSEADFLSCARREDAALANLERLADPWSHEPKERHYARLRLPNRSGDLPAGTLAWAYWDPTQQRAFIHGYFEPAAQMRAEEGGRC